MQDFFGIRYFLADKPPRPDLTDVFTGASGVKIFENAKAYPRAWAVHQAVRAEDAPSAMFRLDLRNTAFTLRAEPPALQPCPTASNDDVQMQVHEPKYVRISAKLACRGLVVLTDTYYPGWNARVDGREADMIEVYGGVRGVLADAGDHTVEMSYRPLSVFGGAASTGIATLIAAWAALTALRGA